MRVVRRGQRAWLVHVGRLRPVDFPMPPPPVRGMALEVVAQLVGSLVERGAVDGATGDALDALVDAWLAQWRQQLEPEMTTRLATLQVLTGIATDRVTAARLRATASRYAHESDLAAHAATTAESIPTPTGPTGPTGPTAMSKELTNGVNVSARH